MAKRARAIVCVSERLASGVKSMAGGGDIVIRPMGVDGERFRFDADEREKVRAERGIGGERVVLYVGKLSPKKGVDVLIRAAAEVHEVKLLIAGDGEKREELQALVNSLGIGDAVEFLGGVPNRLLPGLYSAADAVVVPSVVDSSGETEGMPVVILEALLSGRPVVATTVCGVPDDLMDRGVTTVEPGDHLALGRAILAALGPYARVDREAALAYEVGETARFYASLLLGVKK